jgi:hypothetical protein
MIEALLRSLKHGWLFLHQLDTFAGLERLIAFYVEQYNAVVPDSAFAGQTPDEMYFCPAKLVDRLSERRVALPIPLQFPACCKCTNNSLQCPDS